MEKLSERDACRPTVEMLSLAHERNVEAELAEAIQGDLDAQKMPLLARMRTQFAPNPACVPEVNVHLGKLGDCDHLSLKTAIWRNLWIDNVALAKHALEFIELGMKTAKLKAQPVSQAHLPAN